MSEPNDESPDHEHDHDHGHGHGHGHGHDDQPDPEQARQAAHVVLDGVTAGDGDGSEGAMGLAFERLLEIEAIELTFDEEAGELELDVAPLMSGVMLVVRHLVAEVARLEGVSVEEAVQAARAVLDTP